MKAYHFILPAALFFISSCGESLEDKAEREAEEFTAKNCPMPVAENIVNDSTTFERATRTIHYYYTISGSADTPSINRGEAESMLIKGVKESINIRKYKEKGFNFAYTYYSAKNKDQKLIDITVTPEMYNKK